METRAGGAKRKRLEAIADALGSPMPVPSVDPGATVQFVVDYGTSNLSMGVLIRREDQPVKPGDTRILKIKTHIQEESPQSLAFVKDKDGKTQLLWGHELQRYLNGASGLSDTVVLFQWLKVAVLGTNRNARTIRAGIEEQLRLLSAAERTVEDLFVRHLKELRLAAKASLRDLSNASSDLTTWPIHTLWAVPEVAGPGAYGKLSLLLQKAGWGPFRLYSEAEAAGAWHADKHIRDQNWGNLGLAYPQGSQMVVGDGGGWTFNAASYIISSTLDRGVKVPLQATGKTISEAFGSDTMTTRKAIDRGEAAVADRYGSLDAGLRTLGISKVAFEHTVSQSIESYKNYFQQEGPRTIIVEGPLRPDGPRPSFSFVITKEDMTSWLDDAAEKIKTSLDQLVGTMTRVIVLTGGFFRNLHLIERLQAAWPPRIKIITAMKDSAIANELPVIRGAAPRFPIRQAQKPIKFALGISQDEFHDSSVHPSLETLGKHVKRIDSGELLVSDRWKTLLPFGKLTSNDEDTIHDSWLEFRLPEKRSAHTIEKIVYWTEDLKIQDHTAAKSSGRLRKDIHEYRRIEFTLSQDEVKALRRDYKMVNFRNDDDDRVVKRRKTLGHWLLVRVRTITRGLDVSIELARSHPKYNPYPRTSDIPGIKAVFTPPTEVLPLAQSALLDSEHSAFLQRHTAVDDDAESGRTSSTVSTSEAPESSAGPSRNSSTSTVGPDEFDKLLRRLEK